MNQNARRRLGERGNYEVGYRRPPVHSRFQPGRSGNERTSASAHAVGERPVLTGALPNGGCKRRGQGYEDAADSGALPGLPGDRCKGSRSGVAVPDAAHPRRRPSKGANCCQGAGRGTLISRARACCLVHLGRGRRGGKRDGRSQSLPRETGRRMGHSEYVSTVMTGMQRRPSRNPRGTGSFCRDGPVPQSRGALVERSFDGRGRALP